jgi:MFS family permease
MDALPLIALFVIRLTPGFAFQAAVVATPGLIADLGLDHAQAGLVLGAFTLPGIVVTVPAGLLARRIGDRAVLAGGLALIALGALLGSRPLGFPALMATRVVAGIGGVSVLMLVIKMTTDRYAGPWLSTASAITITSWPVGLALALVALGPVPSALGWRATLGLAGAPALAAMLLIPCVGRSCVRATDQARAEARRGGPPLAFVAAAVLSWSAMNGQLAVLVGFLPGYFVAIGHSIEAAAATASLAVWTPALAIPFGGLLADRLIGRKAAVILGAVGTAAFMIAVPLTRGAAPVLLALGLAFAMGPGPLTAQVGQATPPAARAVVFGWYSAGSYAAMTISPWIAGVLRDASGDARAPLFLAAALSLGILIPYAAVLRGPPRTQVGPLPD